MDIELLFDINRDWDGFFWKKLAGIGQLKIQSCMTYVYELYQHLKVFRWKNVYHQQMQNCFGLLQLEINLRRVYRICSLLYRTLRHLQCSLIIP